MRRKNTASLDRQLIRAGNRNKVRLLAQWKVILAFNLVVFTFTACSSPGVPLLAPEQVIKRELQSQETHQYLLPLEAGQYGRLQIASPGLRLSAKLTDPSGTPLSEFITPESDPIIVSVIAQTKGNYQLDLYSSVANGTPVIYSVAFGGIRLTVNSDNDRLAAEAKTIAAAKLKHEWREESFRRAIEIYGEAQTIWLSINEPGEAGKVFRKIGELYYLLGEKILAHSSYQQALDQYKAQGNLEGQAKVHIDLSELHRRFEDFSDAKAEAEEAQKLGEKIGDEAIINEALVTLEEATRNKSYQIKLSRCQSGLEYWIRNRNIYQQAKTQFKIGHIHYLEGDYKNALLAYSQALQLSGLLADRHREAYCLVRIGNIYSVIGEKQQARNSYDKAEIILEQIGDLYGKATLMGGLGFIFEELGNLQRALSYRQKGFDICTKLKLQKQAATNQMQVARLQHLLGNSQAALDNIQQSYQSFQTLGDQRLASHILRDMGLIYERQGNISVALSHYQKALTLNQLSTQGNEERWKAYALSDIGRIYHTKKQFEQATHFYQQALALNLKAEDSIGQSQTRYYLAKLERDRGNAAEAIVQIEQSISFTESLRTKVFSQELRTSYFASMNQLYEFYVDTLMQQDWGSSKGNVAADALSISERARARSLLDLLNESSQDIKQGVDPQLLEQERSLLQTLNSKADRKLQLASQKGKEAEHTAITKEVEDLSSQLDDVRSKIRGTSPRYAALTQPQPLKAVEIQQLLDDDTLLLEYSLGEARSYLWAVTNHSIEAYPLPNRATIEPLVQELTQLITAPPRRENENAVQWRQRNAQANELYGPRAAKLSQIILGPVAAKLGNKRLLIVGDGALQLLPFAALPEPVGDNRGAAVSEKPNQPPISNYQPLIVRHEITNLPSASSLKLLRQERVKPSPPIGLIARWTRSLRWWMGRESNDVPASLSSVAVLADPVFEKDDKRVQALAPPRDTTRPSLPQTRDVDLSNENVSLPRLIATREEAKEIQKAAGTNPYVLKHGFEVNRGLLESDALNGYGIVHFATHGYWNSTHPELSGIFLSRFDQQGNKRTDGMLRLSDIYNLKLPKELVVLSACETAVGKDIRGEGLIALARGFMYAGAARVMASLWKVDDTATAEMMKIFYQHLLQNKVSPAAALRQAQLAMWQKAPDKIPYNWAAFILQGEYR